MICWYDNQLVNVKWKTIITDSFKIQKWHSSRKCSVTISFYSIYIREVSCHAIDVGIGSSV